MDIKYEALYFPKLIDAVNLPKDNTDFTRITGGIPGLIEAQKLVQKTVEAVKACAQDDPKVYKGTWLNEEDEHPLCRSSFFIREHEDNDPQDAIEDNDEAV
ncbi:hypothetical protein B0O80DRAFT_503830 [Mortierella sp. GBAus27b]|nr:hypothetical protein BGX31_002310 [Mortierella sp. GBA43]KAI8346007.1 hypothetical protein B0O80DRAFT_503830 [Mortierella sp. GBAus27b]